MRILYHEVRGDLAIVFYIGPEVNGIDQKERRDFDDGANALWSLYWKEVKTHDEARVENVAKITDGVLVFVRIVNLT